jgi:hypothetical protein
MDILQDTTTCYWVGIFLFFYAVAALLFILGLVAEKLDIVWGESTLEDVVNYFLVGGAVSGGITLVVGFFIAIKNTPGTQNYLSFSDVGFAIVAMILITAIVSFLAPLLLIVVTFLLKAVVYLVTTLIVKPLQAWGDFLTRKTTGKEE